MVFVVVLESTGGYSVVVPVLFLQVLKCMFSEMPICSRVRLEHDMGARHGVESHHSQSSSTLLLEFPHADHAVVHGGDDADAVIFFLSDCVAALGTRAVRGASHPGSLGLLPHLSSTPSPPSASYGGWFSLPPLTARRSSCLGWRCRSP